jgi:hypothetical protein
MALSERPRRSRLAKTFLPKLVSQPNETVEKLVSTRKR